MSGLLGLIVAFLVLAMALWFTDAARAHTNNGDSVRPNSQGGHMIWESHSMWHVEIGGADGLWADLNCRWDAYGLDCPGVDVDGETSSTGPETVELWDVNNCNLSWIGSFNDSADPDEIYFNSCRMHQRTMSQRQWTGTHEFGHALRLDHPPCTYADISVMVPSLSCARWASPRSHDDNDYYNIWIAGRYGYS